HLLRMEDQDLIAKFGDDVAPLSDIDATAQTFYDQHGEVTINAADVLKKLFKRVATLEDGHVQLRTQGSDQSSLIASLEKICSRQDATIDSLVQTAKKQEEQIVSLLDHFKTIDKRIEDLEVESGEYGNVVRRYVADRAHAKLQKKLRAKGKDELWSEYFNNTFEQYHSWYAARRLEKAEVDLLEKSDNTPFDVGNNSARRPKDSVVERVMLRSGTEWVNIWKFVKDTNTPPAADTPQTAA
ncbi:hypothetical protein Agub_g12545, partial [Astrephomene gubernaculifera]